MARGSPDDRALGRVAGVPLADVAAPRFADELEAQGFFSNLG